MTCIVSVVKEGVVWMGCDSAVCDDDDNATIMRESKITRRGDLLMGWAGSLRLGNLVQHVFDPPVRKARTPDMKYLAGPFVDSLHKLMRDRAPRVEEDSKDGFNLRMLIGYRGGLYFLDGELDICRSVDDFEACGSGAEIARGALFVTSKLAPRTRLLRALSAAERHKTSVRRPFRVVSM